MDKRNAGTCGLTKNNKIVGVDDALSRSNSTEYYYNWIKTQLAAGHHNQN